MVCYPYQSVFYFCFHWKLDINSSYAIPLVSDAGERLQWNLIPVKSLFILRSKGGWGGNEHTHKHPKRPIILTDYLACIRVVVTSIHIVSPVTILFTFTSIMYLPCGRKHQHNSGEHKGYSQRCPKYHPWPLGQCGAAVINGYVTLALSHFSGYWCHWTLSIFFLPTLH